MNYSLELRHEASKEFTDAYLWYEEQQVNLGELFRIAVDNKLNQIRNNPYHYKSSYKKYHEALTDTFPFLIVYTIKEKEKQILVFAIFHTSRNPKKKYR
jgi:plasmid stabilization system protein ParE